MSFRYLATIAVMASAALAKTDLDGCTSSDSVVTPSGGGTPYATRIYFVPGTGEICAALDCGGGRAPPKTTVPGCAAYAGTDTYSPSFIAIKTASSAAAQTTKISLTAAPSAQTTVSAAADGSSMSGSQSGDYSVQTGLDTLVTVSTSSGDAPTAAAGNGTLATTTSRSRATGSNGLSGTGSQTSVPNAAAAGVSNMYGLMAGVALGAAALL